MEHLTRIALVVALTLAGLVALAYGIRTRASARDAAGADGSGEPLTTDELAYLIGGPDRLAETALAGLVADGRIRVSSEGRLSVVHVPDGGVAPPVSRLQALLLAAAAGGGRPAGVVVREVAASGTADEPCDRLTGRRLLLPRAAGAVRRFGAAAPLLAVGCLAAGVALLGGAGPAKAPLLALAAAGLLSGGVIALVPLPTRTMAGEAVVTSARQFGGSGTGAVAGLLDPGVLLAAGGLVAVGGLAAYPDDEIGAALAASQAQTAAEPVYVPAADAAVRRPGSAGGTGSAHYAHGGGAGCGGGCGGGGS